MRLIYCALQINALSWSARVYSSRGVQAIGDNQDLVVPEEVGDLHLVGLELVERFPDCCALVGRVLEFQDGKRQAVDEDYDVGPASVLAVQHRKLIHRQPVVLGSVAEVDDLDLDVDTADAVTAVEWGAGLVEQLADSRLVVAMVRSDDSEVRTVRLMPFGGDWAERVSSLKA